MHELSRYAVGLDVGTTTVRCAVGQVGESGVMTVVGVGEAPNNGMRKGTVVNMVNTAQAIDKALEVAERMTGQPINAATVSVNGGHVVGMSSRGVIAISPNGQGINEHDLLRVQDAATVMQLPANREILEVTPRSYQLDSQDNIKDPIGMSGVRLEVDAHVITTLSPNIKNLVKACEMTQTQPRGLKLSVLAASKVALSQQLVENGVVLIDLGGTTTSLAVYEEGDLQHVAVLPIGSVNITNDLAIGLKTDLDIAEEIKLKHATAGKRESKHIDVTHGKEKLSFRSDEIDEIVDARLEEIFELVNKELKSIGRAAKLPGGAVLTGGGAALAGISEYAKEALSLPVRLVKLDEYAKVSDVVKHPAYATALGLMLIDNEGGTHTGSANDNKPSESLMNITKGATGLVSNLLKRFKS